jgi:hypothetical protein
MAAQETTCFVLVEEAPPLSFLFLQPFHHVVLGWFFALRRENQQTHSPCGGHGCLVQIGRLVVLTALAETVCLLNDQREGLGLATHPRVS